MTLDDWRTFLLSLPASVEEMPFGPDVLVYKVAGKMFALLAWQDEPLSMNLKCEPNRAVSLREMYPAVTAGYHMNKTHWNTVLLDGSIDDAQLKAWVVDSYDLIFNALPKRVQSEMRARGD
ncbi:MAG: MmcQ/YjbR family DNA-binding protein [Formosimonas sp.]